MHTKQVLARLLKDGNQRRLKTYINHLSPERQCLLGISILNNQLSGRYRNLDLQKFLLTKITPELDEGEIEKKLGKLCRKAMGLGKLHLMEKILRRRKQDLATFLSER